MINALLCSTWFRLGGNGYPRLRKWGIPIVLLINNLNWHGAIAGLILFVTTSLQITLYTDDIKDNPEWWIPLLAFLYGLSIWFVRWDWLVGLSVFAAYFLLIIMSQEDKLGSGLEFIELRDRFFIDWAYVEIIFGFILGACI